MKRYAAQLLKAFDFKTKILENKDLDTLEQHKIFANKSYNSAWV